MAQHQQIVLVLLDALPLPPLGVKCLPRHPRTVSGQEIASGPGQAAGKVHHGAEYVERQILDAGQGIIGHVAILP